MRLLATIGTFAALLAGPAAAQFGNAGGLSPTTKFATPGVPAPHQINTADQLFARLAAAGGMAEVEFAQMTQEKAHTQAAKDFASRMIADHGKSNDRLKQLAEADNIPLPTELDAEHQAMRARLTATDGPEFDAVYLGGQVNDHIKTAQLLAWEIDAGEDAELQKFAAETLPTVLEHLRMAQALLIELRVQAAK